MKGLHIFGKELFHRSARYLDIVHFAQQFLHERGTINAAFIYPTPFVRGVEPFINEGVEFNIGNAIWRGFEPGGIFDLRTFFGAHAGNGRRRWRGGNNNGFKGFRCFLRTTTSIQQEQQTTRHPYNRYAMPQTDMLNWTIHRLQDSTIKAAMPFQ